MNMEKRAYFLGTYFSKDSVLKKLVSAAKIFSCNRWRDFMLSSGWFRSEHCSCKFHADSRQVLASRISPRAFSGCSNSRYADWYILLCSRG